MKQLQFRLNQKTVFPDDPMTANVLKMQEEINSLRKQLGMTSEVKPEIKSVLRICKLHLINTLNYLISDEAITKN